jgi:hypothetical protein
MKSELQTANHKISINLPCSELCGLKGTVLGVTLKYAASGLLIRDVSNSRMERLAWVTGEIAGGV